MFLEKEERKAMKKFLVRLFSFVIVMGLLVTPALAQTPPPQNADRALPAFETPTRPKPQEVSQEIRDLFKDGMSVEEFLAANKGPIPNALMEYANLPIMVIVQLKAPSLISYMEKQEGETGKKLGTTTQKSYVAELASAQDAVISQINSVGINAVVISRYTKALNGFMARVAFNDLQSLRSLPGVKSVARAPEHSIDLSTQPSMTKSDLVQSLEGIGFSGIGITVAIIDTGIDYTHAMLGGSGNPGDYTINNPNILEDGTFPTTKVIGGYDFAGTDYDAGSNVPANLIPIPDPDPLDENGHGTHVASIAAGVGVALGEGVAPDALLYALKVFGKTGSTNLIIDAIEWAMDPNQDGSVNDHVDVINMSLGSSFGPAIADDPEFLAVEAANAAGILVVASSGNAGDVNYVTGSPANTDSALSVASSTTGYMTAPFISYNAGANIIPYTTSANAFTSAISGILVDLANYSPGELLCTAPVDPTMLAGKIALIKRGTCSFATKINNAENLGAVAAIIYNNVAGSISMATSGSSLPAGSILLSDGGILKGLAPITVVVGPDSTVEQFVSPTPADTISNFSSRGPRGFDSMLKPEITAPGSDIFAAKMGSGSEGVSLSGTSMASPYIAGVVALMKQAHPNWTNQQIKAALMNTAVDLVDTIGRQVPRQGAGRVDIGAALATQVIAIGDPKLVSMNLGLLELHDNTISLGITVTMAATFTSPTSAGATLVPEVNPVVIAAGAEVTVGFTLNLDVTQLPINFGKMEEYYGYVTFTGITPTLRLPFYFVPRPYPEITETAAETTFNVADFGYVDLEQTGPVASNLWAYPVTMVSGNNPAVMDLADLRYVGMDYGGSDPDYGDIFIPAFNMWAPQHAEQAYWSEVDLWIYGDALKPVVDFNYNMADFNSAGSPNNQWIVIQVDYNDGKVYLASPSYIYADFNSGFQEWYLPTSWSYVSNSFSYDVSSYDWYANEDFAGEGQFDITRPPLEWNLLDPTRTSELYSLHNEPFSLLFGINNLDGYFLSATKGIMLVDYYGKPGVGQATYWPLSPKFYLNLPLISK
jgi:subtilisin family serine protease